jgi:hypothetical protein
LLDATEQQLFRLLSVFVEGCTLEAIAAVSGAVACEAVHLLDRAASLIDKSLLQQIEQEGEEPRFKMLETIREYGLEVLAASGEMEITRQAHAAYYLALAEEAEPEYGGPQQAAWLNRLEQEHDNLRAALHWSVEQAGTEYLIEMALRLGGALWRFWLVHGHVNEGRDFLERALTANTGVAASVHAKALATAANLAVAQNDYHQTEALSRESLVLYRELGDQSGIAFSLHLLGVALWNKGNLTAGCALIEEALTLFRKLRDTVLLPGRSTCLRCLTAARESMQGRLPCWRSVWHCTGRWSIKGVLPSRLRIWRRCTLFPRVIRWRCIHC